MRRQCKQHRLMERAGGFFRAAAAFLKKIWHNPQGRTGLILIAVLAAVALLAPVLAPYDPYDVALRDDKGLAPSAEHLLGTSITTGQDVFSMLLYGTRVSMCIGIVTGLAIAFLGSILGVAAGYAGIVADTVIMRLVDVMLVIPTLPLTILITNVFGKSYVVIVLVFVLLGWPGLARTVRSQVLQIKNNDYVKAAELAGAGRGYIMFRHILPGVSHLVVMSTALTCAGIMIAEAGLSFLGLGNPTTISWGKMLADAQSGGSVLFGQWWTIIAPGIGIFLAVFSFMRVGLAVEEILNPNMRKQGSIKKLWKHMNGRYLDEAFGSMEDDR